MRGGGSEGQQREVVQPSDLAATEIVALSYSLLTQDLLVNLQ